MGCDVTIVLRCRVRPPSLFLHPPLLTLTYSPSLTLIPSHSHTQLRRVRTERRPPDRGAGVHTGILPQDPRATAGF